MLEKFATITSLALVDAINPCTLAVQVLLLSSLLASRGRKSVLIGGILFSLTIYAMYALYGLGILAAIYAANVQSFLKIILKALLIFLASLEIIAFFRYRPGLVSVEMPKAFRPFAKSLLLSVQSPLMTIPVAALCSVLLLPCSSGPYAVALMIVANWQAILRILTIAYYNLLFIIPMIAITLIVYFGTKPKKILEWREKHIREIHLISGLLLLLVFFLT